MHGLGTLPSLVLPSLLARAPLTPEKVTFVWGVAVGSAMARSTSAVLDAGTLIVHADASWAREVERSSPLILSRVQHLLGRQTVSALRVATRVPR
jgi:hypothetical protein